MNKADQLKSYGQMTLINYSTEYWKKINRDLSRKRSLKKLSTGTEKAKKK